MVPRHPRVCGGIDRLDAVVMRRGGGAFSCRALPDTQISPNCVCRPTHADSPVLLHVRRLATSSSCRSNKRRGKGCGRGREGTGGVEGEEGRVRGGVRVDDYGEGEREGMCGNRMEWKIIYNGARPEGVSLLRQVLRLTKRCVLLVNGSETRK